ncbi:MAG: hypothetical protein M0T84_13735 [Betaproteobacteria bacterium]|nr:hypothetical protein [Betaproteobacteria bacterium]
MKRLAPALAECENHVRYLRQAIAKLGARLNAEDFARPDDVKVATLDQFIFRFTRLQDAMGRKLLRALLVERYGEPYEDAPFRDVIDRLEQLGALPSADRWDEFRTMRNHLGHDYPETDVQKAENLNLAVAMAQELIALCASVGSQAADGSSAA